MKRATHGRVLAGAVLAACCAVIAGVAADDKAPPAAVPSAKGPAFWVKSAGEMRDVMLKGNLDAHFDLSTLRTSKGLYAIGPVEGLQGEITVLDGKPSITTLRDGKPVVHEAWPKACFLVYAEVDAWRAVPVAKEVDTVERLEAFVAAAAKNAGIDTEKPFPFRVAGTPAVVKYHVIWKSDGLPHTQERHQNAKVGFEIRDREVEMIGFYSDKHQGVFTHHGSNVHAHVRSKDGSDAGHIDSATFGGGLKLFLPSTTPAENAHDDHPRQGKGPPAGKGKGGKDAEFVRDRDVFHFLLDNHKAITRKVKKLDNGVETVTESDKADVARKIQEHVPAMYERLKSGNGVRYWDPLFAEAFRHGKKMKMTIENTKSGVKVVETSDEADVVKIIQAHAEVVSKFVEHGFDEAHKEHAVPDSGKKK